MHRHLHPVGPPATGSSLLGIVLAEDHPIMRHSLRLVLDAEREMVVLAEATDLETATRDVHRFHPHVLLLDLNLPNGAGTDTIRLLRRDAPGTQVVVLTMHDSAALARHAHEAGALGFVVKDSADEELIDAVRHAARGEGYTSPRALLH